MQPPQPPLQPPVQPPIQSQPSPVITPTQDSPKNALALIGFILAFISSIAGLIVSIIALVKSRRTGVKSTLALWGVIISSVLLVIQLITTIVFTAFLLSPEVTRCLENGSAYVVVDGEVIECPALFQDAGSYSSRSSDTYAAAESIVGTPVTESGSISSSACWSLTIPTGYLQSPNASQCQTELRYDDGTSTGSALTSITLKAQIGDTQTVDDFFATMDEYAANGVEVLETKTVTVGGREAGYAKVVNGYSLVQHMYFIPDTTGSFKASNGTVTSFLLTGPSYNDGTDPVEDIAASITFND